MANNTAKYGFRLNRGGVSPTGAPQGFRYPVVSNYDSTTPVGTAGIGLRPGDPVNLLTDGTVQALTASAGTPISAATKSCFGVVYGIEPVFNPNRGQVGMMERYDNLPTGVIYGTNLERQSAVLIYPAVGYEFEVDVDDNVTATTEAAYQALVGSNCAMNYTAVAPRAFPRLDISTTTAAVEQVRIVGISRNMANQDFSGLNVKLIVRWNLVQEAPFGSLLGAVNTFPAGI